MKAIDYALLTGRLSVLPLFLFSFIWKVADIGALTGALAAKGFRYPALLAVVAAAGEISGALALALGIVTRLAAACLIVYTVLVTITIHDFWMVQGPAWQAQAINFLKNIGFVGVFAMIGIIGPGRLSLDYVIWRKA